MFDFDTIKALIARLELADDTTHILASALVILVLLIIGLLLDLVARVYMMRFLSFLVHKTPTKWDDILLERKVFNLLSHLVPAIVVFLGAEVLPDEIVVTAIQRIVMIYIAIIAALFVDALLSALHTIYQSYEVSRNRPIKGYLQAIKVLIFIVTLILIVSIAIGERPTVLLGTLGAFTAVLMLVFKDPILGFAAGIQLSANNLVRKGDWIVVPDAGADGDVIDISLLTVTVQNWDKTITTVPIYQLVSQPFTNWRGMSESGGRRIKRSLFIDVNTIRFLTPEDIERLKKIQFLHDYLDGKHREIESDRTARNVPEDDVFNARRLTNIGTFRAYISAYLRKHPHIHQDMTFLVRQLQPEERGLPIEIYVFSREQRWTFYEDIQSDIFDHLLAIVPQFDLRVFQKPSGRDIHEAVARLPAS